MRVGIRAFRVGGKGLGSVFIDVLAVSGLGSAWSFSGVHVGPLGWVVGGCLGISV